MASPGKPEKPSSAAAARVAIRAGPRHAARPLVWAYWVLGIACVPLAGLSLVGGNAAGAVIALALAAASIGVGRSIGGRIEAVQLTSTAVQHLTRGNLVEAEAVLAAIPAQATRRGVVARAVALLRAMISLYEGRIDESVGYATIAIEGRLGLLTRSFEAAQVAAAHAVRGLAHAARGDTEKAKADADTAQTSIHATPEVIARARMVRAILASRAAYHEEAFRAYLVTNAQLVLEHAMPRERALFRALRRMSRSPNRSVYREPGRVQDDQAPSRVASWIAHVAPEAAAYVEGDRSLAEQVDEIPVASGVPSDVNALVRARAGKSSAARPGRSRARILGLWAAMVVLLVAMWQAFSTPHRASAPVEVDTGPEPSAFASALTTIIVNGLPVVVLGLVFVMIMSFGQRQQRALALARRQAALGHRDAAKKTLAGLVTASNGIIAATAGLELARLAAAEADFAEAISRCDAAIARVDKQPLRAAASDLLLPALMTESAVAMAARGGLEDADAELAVLCRDFPTYPHLASAQLRVRLVREVRAGDRDAACALARARTAELPLPYREDILADLVLASRRAVSEEDSERLGAELQDDAALRHWIDTVGPGLRDARSMPHARIATPAGNAADPGPLELSDEEEEVAAAARKAERLNG